MKYLILLLAGISLIANVRPGQEVSTSNTEQPSIVTSSTEPVSEPNNAEMDKEPVADEKPEETPPEPPEDVVKTNPQGCDRDTQWILPDGSCKAMSTPQVVATGSCRAEISQYPWNDTVATNVMLAESSGDPGEKNPNASTGDYSIGCFQINLLGSANMEAKYRDAVEEGYTGPKDRAALEAWLKNAANNVAVAYNMYASSGWQPWGHTTCRYKVSCY